MTNENLPPERPLSDQARAQRRSELMQQITEDGRHRRGWLVPALAAASVIAVVSVGGAVLAGGDEPSSRPLAPAGSGPAEPSAVPETPAEDTEDPAVSAAPSIVPGEGASSGPAGDFPVQPPEPCGELQIPVSGASEQASIPIGETTVHLFVSDSKWIVCDDWASLDGGVATLLRPHANGAPIDQAQLGISQNFSMDDPTASEYVAGGALPEGVESITYTFSDGHVEKAVLDGDMWAMAYFASGDSTAIDGATVDVVTNGASEQFTLSEPQDFCTQSNHGC
jgi:hypothetical protein